MLDKLATALSVTADELQVRMTGHVVTAGKEAVETEPQLHAATTLTQRVYLSQPPRLPTFAGESGYDSWRAEVDKLQQDKSLTADDKYRAVSQSLRGTAGRVARRLGPDIDLLTLLRKLEKKFARTARGQHLMREFYSLQQEEDEDVSSWACRLEDLPDQAEDAKRVQDSEMNELLCEQFWTGLRGDASLVVIPITLDPTAHREVNYRGDNVEEVKVQDRSLIYPLLALTTLRNL